tara:strand:+ start:159 stop:536 length:378 start_codon:yes stop_codon:yes gene_type:complete
MGVSLTDAVQTGDSLGRLWPTPSASVANDGETPQTWQARADKLKEKGINGNGAGTPLTVEAMRWSSQPPSPLALTGTGAKPLTTSCQRSIPAKEWTLRLNPCFVEHAMGMPSPFWTLPSFTESLD